MNSPVFDNVAKHTIFEGHRYRIIRHDGTVEDTEFKKLVAEISIDLKNYESTTVEDILRKIDECAVEMGKQQTQHFFEVIEKTVEDSGNTVSCNGEHLAPKHVFEMLEKVEISFNKDNTPILPTFVAASSTSEKIREVFRIIEDTPELKEKWIT